MIFFKIINPFPLIEIIVGSWYCRVLCRWYRQCVKTYENLIACWDMISWFHDGCFNHTTVYILLHRTDFTSVNRPGRIRAGNAFYHFYDIQPSPVTAAHELVTSVARHGATSPSSRRQLSWAGHRLVSSSRRSGRARTATCAFYVLAADEPSPSAVLLRAVPRHVSTSTRATSSSNS